MMCLIRNGKVLSPNYSIPKEAKNKRKKKKMSKIRNKKLIIVKKDNNNNKIKIQSKTINRGKTHRQHGGMTDRT